MMQKRNTAFYIETLILLVMFISVLTLLTGVFMQAQSKTKEAGELNGAVTLAKNTAETVSASDSEEELESLLDRGNLSHTSTGICVKYNDSLAPDPLGEYSVYVTYDPVEQDAGVLVSSDISVQYAGSSEPCYSLSTSVYLSGEAGK